MQFEDLKVWKKSKALFMLVHRTFGESKDYYLRNQILKAALSISNNIAEGFERNSQKEFSYFLYVAKGSCGELRSMLRISIDLDIVEKEIAERLYADSVEISRMLSGLIKKVNDPL